MPRLRCLQLWHWSSAVTSHARWGGGGGEKQIGFVSRTLCAAAKKYSQVEEALACVVGMNRFRSYLWGHHFILQTDNKPLLSLLNEHNAMARTGFSDGRGSCRCMITPLHGGTHPNMLMQMHSATYPTPGQSPIPALMMDQLQDAPITATQIAAWTTRDPLMARVLQYVRQG